MLLLSCLFLLEKPTNDQPQIVLVFFLGGCSFAEISALRFLTNREECELWMLLNFLKNIIIKELFFIRYWLCLKQECITTQQ